MKFEIKPIDNTYSDRIINLILNIQQKEFNIPISIKDQPDLLNIDHVYRDSGGNFWGAFVNGELVGTIALIRFDDNAGAIRKMFVKKEFRGKEYQVGQMLLEILISYCRENGIDKIMLGTVSVLKAAIRFYERNRFKEIAKEKLPSRFPLMAADNVFYALNLKEIQ